MGETVRLASAPAEDFTDLADVQARAEAWCAERAGIRIHSTTAQRAAEMFAELEASCLLTAQRPTACRSSPGS